MYKNAKVFNKYGFCLFLTWRKFGEHFGKFRKNCFLVGQIAEILEILKPKSKLLKFFFF